MSTPVNPSWPELMAYLPAIYHEDGAEAGETKTRGAQELPILVRYLRAYSELLLTSQLTAPGKKHRSLEQVVDSLQALWRPSETPDQFLPWLASWVALAIVSEIPHSRLRSVIANAIPLYRIRGTKLYVLEMLRLYLDTTAAIDENVVPAFKIKESRIGVSTYLGGGPPYFFRVKLIFRKHAPADAARQRELARRVVDLAKPAHTYYELDVISPKMQILVHSTVGVDTVLIP